VYRSSLTSYGTTSYASRKSPPIAFRLVRLMDRPLLLLMRHSSVERLSSYVVDVFRQGQPCIKGHAKMQWYFDPLYWLFEKLEWSGSFMPLAVFAKDTAVLFETLLVSRTYGVRRRTRFPPGTSVFCVRRLLGVSIEFSITPMERTFSGVG
jgi:hypothetical protein